MNAFTSKIKIRANKYLFLIINIANNQESIVTLIQSSNQYFSNQSNLSLMIFDFSLML